MGRWVSQRTTRSAWRLMLVALLGVLAVAAVAGYALAKPSPPSAPAIAATPTNPTNATTASFTYSDTDTIQKFQCALDNAAFADCGTTNPATKTPAYSGLAAGSHTFQVRAVNANGTSSATSYTWVIDLTPPTVLSINRAAASPTNAASLSWTVTFSEAVSGVDLADFTLAHGATPTGGTITVSPTGPATIDTVSAPSGSGDGNLGLSLNDNDSILDAAGNKLGGPGTGTFTSGGTGNGSFTGQVYAIDKTGPANGPSITAGPAQNSLVASTNASFSFSSSESGVAGFECKLDASAFAACSSPKSYSSLAQGGHDFSVRAVDALGNPGPASALRHWTVDTVAPPAPVFGTKPTDPNSSATSTFIWNDSEAGVTYLCSVENGSFAATVSSLGQSAQPCSSPLTYNVQTTNNGQHQFAVEAVDAAGNVSQSISYSWKVDKGTPAQFVIHGSVSGLAPGTTAAIPLTLDNPNTVAIFVTQLTFTLAAGANSGTCSTSNYSASAWNSDPTHGVPDLQVPANAVGFVVPVANRPSLTFLNSNGPQDNCKGKSFTLNFSGSAHS